MKSYGIDSSKLQIGLATYGRGFNKVPNTASALHPDLPGFDQIWDGPSQFAGEQDGMASYKTIKKLVDEKPEYGIEERFIISRLNSCIKRVLKK